MKMRYLVAAMVCAAVISIPLAARADSVRADWNHNINFEQFHTYSWGKVNVSDPFDADRIKDAIDQQLRQKGWELVPEGGQVTICVKDRIKDEQQAETYYDGLGGGWGMGWGWGGWGWGGWGPGGFGEAQTKVRNVAMGHMVIDMFETGNKQLIWRGISEGEIHNNPDKERKTIYEDIGKLLYSFPPKGGK